MSARARGLRRFEPIARLEVAAAAFAIRTVLRLLGSTVTWTREGTAELERAWASGRPVLMAFWHGRSIMLPFVYRGRGACIMNSQHRDGEIVSRVLAGFGIQATRGSQARGAVPGFLNLVRASRRGLDIALIPDGSRGPAGIAKGGAAELAIATGAPLFPMAVSCTRAWRLGTWDRLLLPKPFSRMVFVVGEPLLASRAEPAMASRDEPSMASGDEPSMASRDEPSKASRDEPSMASEDEPSMASEDEPSLPSGDEPRAAGRPAPALARATRADERESLRAELERRLRRVTAEADRLAGRFPVEET
jgi:lysophospholipid acyltransferase (LPLAT)-like uncharacterized protein